MSTSDIPVLDFGAPGAAHPLPAPRGRVVPIRFDDAVRRAEHRQRLLRRVQEMQEAATLAARQQHEQATAGASERGRALGREVGYDNGYQAGYVEGAHHRLWLGFVLGVIASALLAYAAVQVRAHWPARWQQLQGVPAMAAFTV